VTRDDVDVPIIFRPRSETMRTMEEREHRERSRPDPARGRPVYSSSVRFEVLGPTRVMAAVRAGTPDHAQLSLGGPKQRLVLALLLAEPNRVVSIDRLVDGLWGDEPPDSARHTVQSYVSELRKVVGPVIEREGTGYRIHADRDSLDALDFEARVAEGRALADTDPVGASTVLEEALELWRGAPFDDLGIQPMLQAESARLGELHLVAIEALMQARLDAGRHADVVAELDRLTRLHPYREEFRALHMVALYRSGRQADALRAYRTTRDVLGEDLGLVPSPRLRRLEEQILLQDPDLDAPADASSPIDSNRWVENPYLGLRAFREADHARFFGQERLVDRLVARVTGDASFTAVVGPSGSGKSSAVQAGLIPRLRRDHPEVAIALMQPGAQPFGSLDAALAEATGTATRDVAAMLADPDGLTACAREFLGGGPERLVVVIDQFEELFTMVDDAESRRFLDLLARGARDEAHLVHVVATLRADFYDRPLADPNFGQLFADNVVTVVALGPDELESAATLPARQLDIDVEPRLVGRLVADVAGQPNALPLFQYALTELFDARSGPTLDLATYERIGGVRKAVARRAESLYGQLDTAEREAARQLFLRIVTVSGDVVGRRRVPASELVSLDIDLVALRNVIDAYARYRLLALDRDPATGSPTVEVAHEALLSEWHRLRDWIDRHRADLSKQSSFLAAVNEWESSGRDPGYLLHGTRLDDYRSWAASTGLRLTATEHDFLTAAVAAGEADAADEAQREQHRLRLQRRARRQLAGLFVAAAALAGVIAYPVVTRSGDPDRIVAVLDTRRDESSFDALIARGVEQSGDEFGLDVAVVEPPYTDVAAEVAAAADGASLVFGGFLMSPVLLDLAGRFPETTFALLDTTDAPLPNTVAVSYAAEQGSYLVGAAAALQSTTGKVGFIGANASPAIEPFRAGFEQGVAAVDPDVEIVSDQLFHTTDGVGYTDAPVAHDLAVDMYEQGVDVIFVAAGGSGTGVIEAAAERSTYGRPLWAIGVDSDQYYDISADQREHLLTSMFKRMEAGISAVVDAYEAGTLPESGTFVVGAAEGAVGYTDTGGHLDDTTVAKLEALRTGIVDGSIVVDPEPAVPPELDPGTGLSLLDLDTGSTAPLPERSARIDDFTVSPDGNRLAGGPCCSRDDRITVSDIDGSNADTLTPSPGRSQYGASWSPDGEQLVVQERLPIGADAGRLVVIDLGTGAMTTIADFSGVDRIWWLAPSFSADGERVLFQLARDNTPTSAFDVWSVPVTGGEPELVVRDAAFPEPLADGSIAVVSGQRGLITPERPTISIVDARGGVTALATAESWVWQPRLSPDGTRLAYVEGDPEREGGRIRVVDIATGEDRIAGRGDTLDWLDDDTLVVAKYGP
jgi:basic membrane lipoprotein Med (substrate-binding protein (PBP1-ABC) superfamily)/DNA-binding SARP family transcriptional activator